MARQNEDLWIPIEFGSQAFSEIQANSAVEALGRHEPMATETKEVARVGAFDVPVIAKGSAYGEASGTDDVVTLRARKFAEAVRIAEEDLRNSPVNIIAAKQTAWATGYARSFDNAALGTTGAMDGTTVPFESVYYTLSQANAGLGYTANANIVKTAGAVTYAALSDVVGLVEQGHYFGNVVVIAHPSFKGTFRGLTNSQGSPIFVQGLAGTPDTLFGYRVQWSQGARTSAARSAAPSGNPLLVVANQDALIVGDNRDPETMIIPGWQMTLTDETVLKGRAIKGFALAHPTAAAVLEVTAS